MTVPDPVAPDPSEREKWEADVRLRERELAVKEREQEIKHREAETKAREIKRSRWTNPLVLAVLAAALAAGGNAIVALINGEAQRTSDYLRTTAEDKLQAEKATEERQLEEGKAEAARILEMIKTADPDKAAINLRFLLDSGLIVEPDRREKLAAYLKNREQGKGPSLPPVSPFYGAFSGGFGSGSMTLNTYECVLKHQQNADSLSDAMLSDLRSVPWALIGGALLGPPYQFKKAGSNIEITTLPGTPLSGVPLGNIQISGSDDHVIVRLDPSLFFTSQFTEIKVVALETLKRLSVDPSCVDKAK